MLLELNPVEYIWGYWKQHSLPNVCPKDYWSLDQTARKTLKRMRRRPRLSTAFWKQAELSFSRLYIMRKSIGNTLRARSCQSAEVCPSWHQRRPHAQQHP